MKMEEKILFISYFIVVQSLSHIWLFVTPRTAACQTPLSSTISQGLLIFMSIETVMLSNHLILCHLLSSCPQPFSALVFSNESDIRIRWPKNWSFSISPFNEYSELISSRIDWFDCLFEFLLFPFLVWLL